MSYNSLVWTKENNTLYFDTNVDNVSPGFRLGFPTIEPAYFVPGGIANDPYWAYVMVTPSGGRVEFKQSGVTKYFETADSSYLQLEADAAPDPNIPVDDINLTLRGTDGSVLKFVWAGGAFRCSEIKDRNGNYIEVEHDELGLLRTITDTLGREIDVNYDSELFPTSISQSWKTSNGTGSATTHNWAEFEYTTIYPSTDFADGLAVAGPPNGWPVKVLHRVIYPDDSFTVFHYNDYAQVWKVENFAADDTLLNHVRTDLQSPAADQTDVPRFTETRSWVQNFNGGNETRVAFTRTPNSSFSLPGSISGTGLLIEAELDNDPYASVTKTWIGETGWKEGLPLASEDHAKPVEGGTVALQRWSWTNWTQDDVNASEQMNPRVVETRIGDGASTKKTQIDYRLYPSTTITEFGLVDEVRVYGSDLSTVLKKQETDYNLSSTYLDRRIIGLPSKTQTYGWNDITQTLELASELTYAFDGEDFSFEANQVISPIRHDTANFGSSFVAGRGNLTSVTRHDVTSQTGAVTSKTRYDIAGSVVSRLDPLNRKVRFEYSDAFNDDVNRNSFAYPTKVYDPANNFSEAKYRFDIGANVWARSPAPAGQTVGKTTLRVFDSIGRLEKETIDNSGAYTRYAYPTNGVQSQVYTTIVDTNNNNTGDTADEVLSETWTDGAGRVRRSRTEHPGSVGGWVGSIVEYDILGRTKRSSVPTEISVPNVNNPDSWQPAGDDDRGLDGNGNPIWLWTHQRYDWMGRVVRKIATDGDPNALENDSDVLISYAGCGCAGGLETTIQGELVPRTDGTSGNARRKQKVYQDILGRTFKTETYNWNGTVYSTSLASFNERDQVLRSRQFEGDTSSTTFQDTTTEYDGHGRAWRTHTPEQRDSSNNPVYTVTTFNIDDSINSITDGRGSTATYTYNTLLGLVSQIDYSVPQGSNIPVTPAVSYQFDVLGNRTQMIDGSGTTVYSFDELSRITAETKTFSGRSGDFTLTYQYTLSGDVKRIDLPNGTAVLYTFDKMGRVRALNGAGFQDDRYSYNIDNLMPDIQYRAWGGIKSMEHGSSAQTTVSYDNRLKTAEFRVPGMMEIDYEYSADGRVKFQEDLLNPSFDRSYEYDHQNRLVKAKSGAEASGGTSFTGPYRQNYEYDAFNNMTLRDTWYWSENTAYGFSANYTYNRRSNWQHDFDGNVTADQWDQMKFKFDADGANSLIEYPVKEEGSMRYETKKHLIADGDGDVVIQKDELRGYLLHGPLRHTVDENSYSLKATPLGGVVVLKQYDKFSWEYPTTTYTVFTTFSRVFLGSKLFAEAYSTWGSYSQSWQRRIHWIHNDPSATTVGRSDINPAGGAFKYVVENLDPAGARYGLAAPEEPEPPDFPGQQTWEFGSPEETDWITVDGITAPASHWPPGMLASAARCPNDNCGPIAGPNGLEQFHAFADGYQGYMEPGGTYVGGGYYQTRDQRRRSQASRNEGRRARRSGQRPQIKNGTKLPPGEGARRRAAGAGLGNNEDDFSDLRPPSLDGFEGWFKSIGFLLRMATLVDKRVKVIGFNPAEVNKIVEMLFDVVSNQECYDAFKAAGLPATAEVIRDRGITFVRHDALRNPVYNSDIGIDEERRRSWYVITNRTDKGGTTFLSEDPKFPAVTVFPDWSLRDHPYPFREAFVHEGLHQSGVGKEQTFLQWMSGNHDLANFERNGLTYQDILNICRVRSEP